MATKIRLARHGKKGKPFYHIVIADSRAKRDGRYIERIGSYDPNKNPAIIDINFDRALYWVGVGAQPTDTVRGMLSYRGVLYKNHLLKGIAKGALTEAQADDKYNKWLEEKESKIESKISSLENAEQKAIADALNVEKEKSAARAKAISEAQAVQLAKAEAEEAPATEETPAEEAPAEETSKAEEAPAEQAPATEEAPKAEETPVEEAPAKEETPKAEETPATEEGKKKNK
ncbi:30S ribosomal protein S16 [Flavobacteriales bacterium]|nr:30S ribosomal protein S16 [Flavobacteriales bacterium]